MGQDNECGRSVLAIRKASRQFEEHDMTMTEFLLSIVSGSIVSEPMPTGFPGKKGIALKASRNGFHIFCDLQLR